MIAIQPQSRQPQSRQLLGVNQQAYQALKASMSLDLRRQLLIAVCDNVVLQDQLAAQLERDLAKGTRSSANGSVNGPVNGSAVSSTAEVTTSPGLERLIFDAEEGNLPQQVAQWVRHTMLSEGTLPKVQVLGIEQMTRQPAIAQNYFLRSLEKIEALLPRLNTSLLIWVPWPWLRTIQQSAPTFWNWRNGVYEFVSDPTPTPDRQQRSPLEQPADRQSLSTNLSSRPSSRRSDSSHSDSPSNDRRIDLANLAADLTNDLAIAEQNSTQNSDSTYSAASLYGESEPVDISLVSAQNSFPAPNISEAEGVARDRAVVLPEVSTFLDAEDTVEPETPTPDAASDSAIDEANNSLSEIPFDLFDDGLELDDLNPPADGIEDLESIILTADSAATSKSTASPHHSLDFGGLHSIVSQGVNVSPPADDDSLATLDELLPDIDDLAEASDDELYSDSWDDSELDGALDGALDSESDSELDSDFNSKLDSDFGGEDNDIDDTASAEAAFASLDWHDFAQGANREEASVEQRVVEVSEDTLMAVLSDEEIPVNHLRLDELALAPAEIEMSEPEMPEIVPADQPSGRLKVGDQRDLKSAVGVQVKTKTLQAPGHQKQAADHFTTGLALRNQIESGDRTLETIEAAITAYESGLNCLTAPHADRITALNDLGTLYWLKAQQQKDQQAAAALMHKSIELYQQALTESDSQQPGPVADAQGKISGNTQGGIVGQLYSNTGAVYTMLATCENPLENLTQAAKTYCQAIPLMSLAKEPEEYATLQNSLGSVFWKLSHYDSAETYLQQAITAYNEALLGYKPDRQPMDYAAVQNNLGITYWSLAKHERPEFLLKHAIAAYRDALNYRTSEVDPAACAISYNNLALAYWDLSKHTDNDLAQKSRYQKNAVTAFEAALNISKLSGALSPMDSAAIYHCLGDVHAQMVETAPSLVEVGESLQKSLYSYIKATENLPTDSPAYPGRFGAIVANLRLHYEKLGLEGQQSALNQVPAALLPQVMMTL